jgi:hypothetical protein
VNANCFSALQSSGRYRVQTFDKSHQASLAINRGSRPDSRRIEMSECRRRFSFCRSNLLPSSFLTLTLYNIFAVTYPRGQHAKSYQCASGASGGAQSGAVASRKTRSSYFGDRVVERFGGISECTSAKANHIGSFTAKNGTRSESSMGEGWEGNKARSRGKNELVGSESSDVAISPQKDCSRPKSQMGEDTRRAKEGSLK